MKKTVILFPRQTFQNESDNKKRTYWMNDALAKVLGQAKSIRYQLIGFRVGSGCEVRLVLYESPWDGARAQDVKPGATAFHTQASPLVAPTLRSDPGTITGPFGENVSVALEVRHTTDNQQVEWEGLVSATLILEE